MRRKVLGTVAAFLIASMCTPVFAADQLIDFTTGSTGLRSLTLNVAPDFGLASFDLNLSQDVTTTVPGAVEVTEVLARGLNPWSVKAQMCGPVDYESPTAGDCSGQPARMVRAQDGTGEDMLDGADIDVAMGTPTAIALLGGTTTKGSQTDLSGQITLLNNTGQNSLSIYSGIYANTVNLTIADFDRVGTWKGMWVVTETL